MVTIKINTGNEAFDDPGPEIARILRRLADIIEPLTGSEEWSCTLCDSNGNTVGAFKYTNS